MECLRARLKAVTGSHEIHYDASTMKDFENYPAIESDDPLPVPSEDGLVRLSFWTYGRWYALRVRRYLTKRGLLGEVRGWHPTLLHTQVDVQVVGQPAQLKEFIRWSDRSFGRHQVGNHYRSFLEA